MKKLFIVICAVLVAGYVSAQTKTAVKTADLKKEITDYITKNYAGNKILQAYKVETKKVVTYEVIVQKETAKTTLVFNDKGAFVKAEANKPVTTKPTTAKPTTPEQKTTPSTKPEEKSTTTPPKN